MANTDARTSNQYQTEYPDGSHPYFADRVITDSYTLPVQSGGGVTLPATGQMYPLGYEDN